MFELSAKVHDRGGYFSGKYTHPGLDIAFTQMTEELPSSWLEGLMRRNITEYIFRPRDQGFVLTSGKMKMKHRFILQWSFIYTIKTIYTNYWYFSTNFLSMKSGLKILQNYWTIILCLSSVQFIVVVCFWSKINVEIDF